MIENLLEQSVFKNGYEVSFTLGHKVLFKSGLDWNEAKGAPLTINEWEDLKDLCLLGSEKVQLETKGVVSGIYISKSHSWKFSFIERKECYRAYLSLVKSQEETKSQIENPLFWDSIKKDQGIFIVAGERRQGKTSLIQEVIINDQKNKLSLIGVHSGAPTQNWPEIDSVVQLGSDTLDFEFNHPLYEGIERIFVDTNSIRNWKKWIEIAEQGQGVIITLSTNSIKTILTKLTSELDESSRRRLFSLINGIVVQKLVGINYHPCTEILVIKENQRTLLQNYSVGQSISTVGLQNEFKDSYQSLNQSIIQKLVRRKIDIQAAFQASDDPESLDTILKKMGL